MPNLTKANEARQRKAIKKLYCFTDGGIQSFKNRIDTGLYIRGEKVEVSSVQWNRRKYNRMNNEEQEKYDAKMNIKKAEYRLYLKNGDGCFSVVPKMVYDYFMTNISN